MGKKSWKSKGIWWIFGTLCVLIGLYPILYFLIDSTFGLLATKSPDLFNNTLWNIGFKGHITLGGISLLIGWVQFSTKLRKQALKTHRIIGRLYVISVLISGVCGVYIGLYATGNWISKLGFITLGVFWLITTYLGYRSAVKHQLINHRIFMIYSYAACFAAVTLRIWLPILTIVLNDFILSYKIVAWVSWVPNVLFARYYIIKTNQRSLS